MDVLTAHNPSGFLHAVTCDSPAGFGESFAQTMRAQGCTVTRRSMADHLAQAGAGRAAPEISHPPVEPPALALPAIGETVTIAHLGEGTVTGVLTWPDGTRAALVASRRGAGLARPGEWTAAAPLSGKFRSNSSEPPAVPTTIITAAAAPASSASDDGGGSRMVNLFEDFA